MDEESVRCILQSSGKFMESLAEEKDLDKLIEKVPVLDQKISSALSTLLTDLLSYKVSPDAYQRYSVRMKIIEMIREWIRPPIGLTSLQMFYQSDNVLKLCQGMLKKYLSNDNFNNTTSTEDFMVFGRELINTASRDPLYIPHVKIFVEKIINSDMPFDIYELVESVLNYEEQFQLEFSLVEKLHIINCTKLIEEPLIDCFLINLNLENNELFITTKNFDKLICYTAKSSKIFQIISSILKVLFVRLEYSTFVLEFIQFVLKTIIVNRENDKKCILDLYPLNLQSCVVLLKINPCYHTESSREFILQTLKNIYLKNTDQVLTLLTHFSVWLDPLINYIPELIINRKKF